MDFELAKQLKDAGFPFIEGSLPWRGHRAFRFGSADSPMYDAPTLEQLIEACGDPLTLYSRADVPNRWIAARESAALTAWEYGDYPTAFGKTTDEAVARLWLALNETKMLT